MPIEDDSKGRAGRNRVFPPVAISRPGVTPDQLLLEALAKWAAAKIKLDRMGSPNGSFSPFPGSPRALAQDELLVAEEGLLVAMGVAGVER